MKKFTSNVLNMAGMIVLASAAIIGNNIAISYQTRIDSLLTPPVTLQDSSSIKISQEKGQELSKQIVTEGSVLLKNKEDSSGKKTLPLDASSDKERKVNVFGLRAADWFYGGGGSGTVQPEDGDASKNIDFLKALSTYGKGVNYNRDLINIYANKDYEPSIEDKSAFSDELLNNAKAFSDVGIVVIGRFYSESTYDITFKELELNENEEKLIKYVASNFKKSIVIINSGSLMNMKFLKDVDSLGACLQVGYTGTRGATGLPPLLFGEASPSGKLADTAVYDYKSNPNYWYIGNDNHGSYTNDPKDHANANVSSNAYMDYIENIYVGYKWYETADKMGVWNNIDNQYGKGYDGVVQFPFGYGMSYTNFEWTLDSVEYLDKAGKATSTINDETSISLKVTVKNTGNVKGKDVVECYVETPFNPQNLDTVIEKSSTTLVDFKKTIELSPSEEIQLQFNINVSDFASYDCYDNNKNGFKGYELEDGTYKLRLQTDSHNVKEIKNNSGLTLDNNAISFDINSGKPEKSILIKTDKYTGKEVKNRFTGEDAIDGASIDGSNTDQEINFISRKNFVDPFAITKPESRTMSDKLLKYLRWAKEDGDAWDNATVDYDGNELKFNEIKWGSSETSYKIYDEIKQEVTEIGYKLGADYNDPLWKDVLNQVTIAEAKDVIGDTYGIPSIPSIGKPKNAEFDGPSQIKGYAKAAPRGVGYPSATLLAQTWSKNLAYSFGLSYGTDCQQLSVAGTWGPAMNIHRTPIGNRNFEYYSECAVLSAKFAAKVIKGLQNTGTYPYIKHFVMNDTEFHRQRLFNRNTEQGLREVYLKPFQVAIQESECLGIMTTYGRLGATYTGGSVALNTAVARDEWGFNGSIISDYAGGANSSFMYIDQSLRAGGDMGMGLDLNPSGNFGFNYSETSTPRLQHQMKKAIHHTVYTWLRAMYINKNYNANVDSEYQVKQGVKIDGFNWWKPTMYALDVLVGFGIAIWALCVYWYLIEAGSKKFIKVIKKQNVQTESTDDKSENNNEKE